MKDVVLVTGVAGFIGSHVSERLLHIGYKVIGLDNFDDCYSVMLKRENISLMLKNGANFRLEEGDIRNTDLLRRLFEGYRINAVVHLAARAGVRPSIENPGLYQDINTGGTVNMLEVSRRFGIKRFILTSSSSVYGLSARSPFQETAPVDFPISPYAASKLSAELFGRTFNHLYGLPVVVLRPFTVYGPRQRPEMAISRFVDLIERGEAITLFANGQSYRDYTYIDDIVSGYERALSYDGDTYQVFNLGSGRTVNLTYLVSIIEETLCKKAKIKLTGAQAGEVPSTYADISKARHILGYQPQITIEEGIRGFVAWYKSKGGQV